MWVFQHSAFHQVDLCCVGYKVKLYFSNLPFRPVITIFFCCLGISQSYFAVCSWLWTLVLSYTIYCVVVKGKLWFQLWHVQCLCWTLPIVLALLPLTTNTYSANDPDLQWCLIVPRNDTPFGMTLFWAFASYGFWLFMCIVLMVYWGSMIQWRYWGSIASPVVRRAYEKVWLYPVALSLCWSLNMLCLWVPAFSQNPFLLGFGMVLGVSNGMVNSVIFMRNNREVMDRWMDSLQGKGRGKGKVEPSDGTPSLSEGHPSDSMYRRSSVMLGDGDIAEEDLFPSNRNSSTTDLSVVVVVVVSARTSTAAAVAPPTEGGSGSSSVVRDFEMTKNPLTSINT